MPGTRVRSRPPCSSSRPGSRRSAGPHSSPPSGAGCARCSPPPAVRWCPCWRGRVPRTRRPSAPRTRRRPARRRRQPTRERPDPEQQGRVGPTGAGQDGGEQHDPDTADREQERQRDPHAAAAGTHRGASAGRSAAIGDTRVASRAGTREARTVTTVPTSSGNSTTGRVTSMVDGSGTPRSRLPSAKRAPWPSTSPRTSPATEATAPRIAASTSTDRRRCPLPAPTQRAGPA